MCIRSKPTQPGLQKQHFKPQCHLEEINPFLTISLFSKQTASAKKKIILFHFQETTTQTTGNLIVIKKNEP